jgi:RluA family pseudouridine synthase
MNTESSSIVNVAAYKFMELTGLAELRAELQSLCDLRKLRGTILLSAEGINLFVAGSRTGIDALLQRLREVPGAWPIDFKESFSDEQPFNRMLVKIKREIIAFGVEGIAPARYTSRKLPARQLKQWLDEGIPLTLLDTRNNFEVKTGTFKNAIAIGVDDFRDFPEAVDQLPAEMKSQPVVTFCTGGIRCEKAAPLLEREGFSDVYQLDGGILRYFEECGGAHYDGDCFVFDKRVALNPSLKESGLRQCYACQAILSIEETALPEYVEGKSCPRCHRSEPQAREELLKKRHAGLCAVVSPLPGSIPYDNVRPISVPLRFDGMELLDFLDAMKTHLSREDWLRSCEDGRLTHCDRPVHPGRVVRMGERFFHHVPATREPDVASSIEILHEDAAIVVVNKPAPLPMHPCGRFNRNTLSHFLEKVYRPIKLRLAHRLDADTSGVVVFSKSREAARKIQPQFEAGDVKKRYLARVHGHPAQETFECHTAINGEPGENGVRLPDENGQPASTRFRVLEKYEDGTALLEIHPLTGRTNQIRAHSWVLGMPIVGDPIYLNNQRLGASRALSINDPPLCLHAAAIEFTHPLTNERTKYESPSPLWGRGKQSCLRGFAGLFGFAGI